VDLPTFGTPTIPHALTAPLGKVIPPVHALIQLKLMISYLGVHKC